MKEYPFTILDIAELLQLKIRRKQPTNMDVDCPFCGHKKGKMNINLSKNVFRCNYCGESGGMIELYGKVFQISNAQAYSEICELLRTGQEAGDLPVVQKKLYLPDIEQLPRADLETRHQTYSMLLSQLILTKDHQENLMKRGLSAEQIMRYGYKSTPVFGFKRITRRLMEAGCIVKGVPGFYQDDDGEWTVHFNPKSVNWYANKYTGNRNILRASARLLLEAAG